MVAKAVIDEIRSLGFGGISGSYATIGSAFTELARIICFTNTSDADVLISDDGTTDKLIVPAGAFKLIDVQANQNDKFDDKYVLPVGTQFYVKQVTAPSSGTVYLEMFY